MEDRGNSGSGGNRKLRIEGDGIGQETHTSVPKMHLGIHLAQVLGHAAVLALHRREDLLVGGAGALLGNFFTRGLPSRQWMPLDKK